MSTPSSGGTAATAATTSAGHTIIPAPIATNDQHVCYICLLNDTDTPDATWVNPCPCSLEAHEECLLRWIAEMEMSNQGSKNGFRCQACKAPFIIEEPYDPFLAIRDRVYRRYSRCSPYILMLLVSGGGVAGAACYGLSAAAFFAGPQAAMRWVGFQNRPVHTTLFRMWKLSHIGPALVIFRWLPGLGSALAVPASLWFSANLIAHDQFPSWPPSPQWALALMPFVQLTYSHLFYDLFGPLDRRLNRALRGRPANEEDAAPQNEAGQGVAAPEPAAGAVAAQGEEEDRGIWGPVVNLSRAFLGLFGDLPAIGDVDLEVDEHFEFRIGGGDEDQDQAGDGQVLGEEDLMEGEDGFQILGEDTEEQQQQPLAAEEPSAEEQPTDEPRAEQPAPVPVPVPAPQNQQPPPQNQNNRRRNNNNNNRPPGETVSPFFLLINSVVTSLLLPVISYGMGELIRTVAPKGWVTRSWLRPRGGLLQQQWGRSLVGGCLFVVLRDAVSLYTKYRRVQSRSNRRVKNVERRGERSQ